MDNNWETFFRLRNTMKRMRWIGGLPALFGFIISQPILLSLPIFNPTVTPLGLDPILLVGAASLLGSFGSFLTGSALAKYAWRRFRPSEAAILDAVSLPLSSEILKIVEKNALNFKLNSLIEIIKN